MICWFCEKNEAEDSESLRLEFERFNYADKVAQSRGEQPDRIMKTLTIGRCESCSHLHKQYSRISLFAILPAAVLAYSVFLLFRGGNPNLIFTVMAVSLVGFGAVLIARVRFLRKRDVKALVELEMKNDEIQEALAGGWYRV